MILIYNKESNELEMEVPFTSEQTLRTFSVKSMERRMLDEMTKIKNTAGATWSQTVRMLPAESAIFFMAMGATVASQLFLNYSQNPIGAKHHVEHSLSLWVLWDF